MRLRKIKHDSAYDAAKQAQKKKVVLIFKTDYKK
jgi:hypothetical protein